MKRTPNISDAIQALVPGAKFIPNIVYEDIQWLDENVQKPTKVAAESKLEELLLNFSAE